MYVQKISKENFKLYTGGGHPYIGGYRLPIPFFTLILHPMTPFFLQSTPNNPLFSTFVKYCTYKRDFRVFWKKIINFTAIQYKFAHFCMKLHFCTLNDLHFLKSTPIKTPFLYFGAHTEWPPFFIEILHLMPLLSFSKAHVGHIHILLASGGFTKRQLFNSKPTTQRNQTFFFQTRLKLYVKIVAVASRKIAQLPVVAFASGAHSICSHFSISYSISLTQ